MALAEACLDGLQQWFPTKVCLSLRGIWQYLDTFDCHNGVLPASMGERVGTLLNILEFTGQPLHSKELLGPKCQ